MRDGEDAAAPITRQWGRADLRDDELVLVRADLETVADLRNGSAAGFERVSAGGPHHHEVGAFVCHLFDYSFSERDCHGMCAGVGFEFGEDVADVALDGLL